MSAISQGPQGDWEPLEAGRDKDTFFPRTCIDSMLLLTPDFRLLDSGTVRGQIPVAVTSPCPSAPSVWPFVITALGNGGF